MADYLKRAEEIERRRRAAAGGAAPAVPAYIQRAEAITARQQADAMRTQRAGSALAENKAAVGEATYGPGSDTALATSARAAAQRNIEQSVSPRDTPTVPVALTRMDLQRMADTAPGRKIVPVGGTLQVQDEAGTALSQLASGANVSHEDWWNAPVKEKFLQGITGSYSPLSLAGSSTVRSLAGLPAEPGRGMREDWMDTAAELGKAAPRATTFMGGAAAIPAAVANQAGVLFNEAQKLAARTHAFLPPDVRAESIQQDEADIQRWKADRDARLQEIIRMGNVVQGAPVTPEEGEKFGREVLGVQGSNVADVVNPASTPALMLKGTSKALGAVARSKPVGDALFAAFGNRGTKSPFSNVPAVIGAAPEEKAIFRSADATAREYGHVAAAKTADAIEPFIRLPAADREAVTKAWTNPAERQALVAARPELADAFRVLQPENFAAYQKYVRSLGLSAEAERARLLQYNPNHLYYGQDFAQHANALRTGAAEAGIDPAVDESARSLLKRAGSSTSGLETPQLRAAPDPFLAVDNTVPGYDALYNDPVIRAALTDDAGRFMPGTRVRSSLDQTIADRARMLAKQKAADDLEGNAVSRWWERAKGDKYDESDIITELRNMKKDAGHGLVESVRAVESRSPERFRQAVSEVLLEPKSIETYRKLYGDDVSVNAHEWLMQRMGDGGAVKVLTGYGDELVSKGAPRAVLPHEVVKELKKKGLVIVRPAKAVRNNQVVEQLGVPSADVATSNSFVVNIPGLQAPMIMPRRAALAASQISSGNQEKAIRSLAETMDRTLGSAMANATVTRSHPGFTRRNIQAGVARGIMDDPRILTDRKSIADTVRELKEIGPSEAAKYEGVRLLGLGKDIGQRMDVFNVQPRASSLLPSRARIGLEKVHGALSAPGAAYNNAFDQAATRAAFGADVPPGWGFSDMLRFHHWRRQVREGVDPKVAADWTNTLFINYSDKSAFESVGRSVFPFMKFYANAAQGATDLAMRHPERFKNLFTVANFIRAQDERDGTAINAKSRTVVDLMTGTPNVSVPGDPARAAALRVETPATESIAAYDAIANELGIPGAGEGRAGSLLGAGLINSLKWAAPGKVEELTGYAPMNIPKPMRDAYSAHPNPLVRTVPGMAAAAAMDTYRYPDEVGGMIADDHPYVSLAWDTLRTAPFISNTIPPYFDTLARGYTGALGYQARTPESRGEALWRLGARSLGPRPALFDVLDAAGRKREKTPKSQVDIFTTDKRKRPQERP